MKEIISPPDNVSNLNAGIYIVNLVVNGKIVDGKQLLVIQ